MNSIFIFQKILTRVNVNQQSNSTLTQLAAILGFTNFLRQGKTVPLVLPAFEVHGEDYDKIAANLDANITVQNVIIDPQQNKWVATFSSPGLYVMQIVLGIISLGLIIFGGIKFRAVLQWFNGCKLSITHLLIWIEIIANFRKYSKPFSTS